MESVNQMLVVASVLDPRYKLGYLEFCFCDFYKDEVLASTMTKNVKATLMSIYEWYVGREVTPGSRQVPSLSSLSLTSSSAKGSAGQFSKFKEKMAARKINDVERYLFDDCEDIDTKDFDVLNWWKVNETRYGILSKLVRDILGVQVSTMTAESAFCTDGRILDPFHSSLTPRMLELLVCTQNWLKGSAKLDGFCMEDVEYYSRLDEVNIDTFMPLLN